jgi:symplekin
VVGSLQSEIIKFLPRIVSLLNGKPAEHALVKSMFSNVVATPPQTFGTVSSNVPRVKQSELLAPVELLVLLHQNEKEIGPKSAIEGLSLGFCLQ